MCKRVNLYSFIKRGSFIIAERRMFAKTIIDSDAFIDLPLSTQALYFHLSMRADDDGFINNPKKIMRMIGAGDDELKMLFLKKFIIGFESGVLVIKHWKIHNYIQKDRYKETVYLEEKSRLKTKENSVYTLDTEYIQDVRLGKVRLELELDKSSKELDNQNFVSNTIQSNNCYSVELPNKTIIYLSEKEIETLKKRYVDLDILSYCYSIEDYCKQNNKTYKSLYSTINNWVKSDIEKSTYKKTNNIKKFEDIKKENPDFIVLDRNNNTYMLYPKSGEGDNYIIKNGIKQIYKGEAY
jgi:hypothetical protein